MKAQNNTNAVRNLHFQVFLCSNSPWLPLQLRSQGGCAHCCSIVWGHIPGKNELFFIRCDLIMVKYRVQNIKNSELLKILLQIYSLSNLSVKGQIDPFLPLTAFFLRFGPITMVSKIMWRQSNPSRKSFK